MPTGFSLFRESSSSFLFSLCRARVYSKGAENSIRHCSALWVVIVEVEGNDEGNTSFTCLGGSGICYSNRWWRKSLATITKKVIFFEPRSSVPKISSQKIINFQIYVLKIPRGLFQQKWSLIRTLASYDALGQQPQRHHPRHCQQKTWQRLSLVLNWSFLRGWESIGSTTDIINKVWPLR